MSFFKYVLAVITIVLATAYVVFATSSDTCSKTRITNVYGVGYDSVCVRK